MNTHPTDLFDNPAGLDGFEFVEFNQIISNTYNTKYLL